MTDYDFNSDFSVDGLITSSKQGTLMGTYLEMPTATAEMVGMSVQYTGVDGVGGFRRGYFYQCQEVSPGNFAWQTDNPPGGGGGGTTNVTWNQVTSGLKIAAIGIDGAVTDVKIPYASASSDGIITPTQLASIDSIGTISTALGAEVTRATAAEGALSTALASKQDALTSAQLAVLGSGITATKVSTYDSHVTNNSNPHNVTATQVGLGNVNNTSDVDKPVSTAQQTALNLKQDKNLGSAKADLILTTDGAGNIGTDGSIQKGKLQLIKNLTSDAQAQINNKVDKVTGYSLSKITLNGSETSTPTFYAPTSAGTTETYLYWDPVTSSIGYKNLPAFIQVKGNKTGDELNSMTGASVGDLYVCTVDSTTAPVKYANTAYYWASDNTWAIFCQTTIDLSTYLLKQTTSASVVMVSDASKNIIASSIGTDKLNYLSSVTSNIQDQLDGKQATITGSYLSALQSGITSAKVGQYDAHKGDANIHVTSAEKSTWNGKQDALVSGTSIKTINGQTVLGSGDITIASSTAFSAITGSPSDNTALATALNGKQASLTTAQLAAANSGIDATKVSTMTSHMADTTVHVTTTEKNAWNAKQGALTTDQLAAVNSGITAAKVSTYTSHVSDTGVHVTSTEKTTWNGKQNALVSGSNIKTVAGVSIVGSGDANIIAPDWNSTSKPKSAAETLEKIKEYGATFRGTVPLKSDLASIVVKDINDWAIVTTDVDHGNLTSRYCWDGTAWIWQYSINNMAFTTEQLAAINSGATSTKIASYDAHLTNTDIHFTSAERTKLNGIETGANKTIVDTGLSDTSTNPVQNKAIKAAIDDKVSKNMTITAGTKCKITFDGKGLVTAGADLEAADIPDLASKKITTMTDYSIGGAFTPIATTDTLNQAVGKLEYGLTNVSNDAKLTGYAMGSSYTPIATTDTLNQAIGKMEYGLNNPGAISKLTGYVIASTVSALTPTMTLNEAIAILEKRIKNIEDAPLARYGDVPTP